MASGQWSVDSFQLYRNALQSLSIESEVPARAAPGGSRDKTSEGSSNPSEVSKLANAVTAAAELQELSNFPPSFPSVKRIPGTPFIVDGFRSAGPWSVSYFLSHFHSDHYTGLSNVWTKGLVFCSEITAHLVKDSLQVPNALIVPLGIGCSAVIDGCEVTLVDANHCPGAVQFLFRIQTEDGDWKRYVHCGDMRFSPSMKDDTSLCDFVGADAVFLDTTYCNPKFVFPPQQTSVDYVAETVHRQREADSGDAVEAVQDGDGEVEEDGEGDGLDLNGEDEERRRPNEGVVEETDVAAGEVSGKGSMLNDDGDGEEEDITYSWRNDGDPGLEGFRAQNAKSTLFLISTYVIGKEKILTAVAKRCKCKIYVTEKKLNILGHLDIEDIAVFTTDPRASNVHVVKWSFLGETWPYFRPNFKNMEKALAEGGYKKVVGFVPTGWTYELKKKTFSVRKKGPFEIHLVPYSEHSNYEELREYVGFLRPKEIIPTVGLDGGGIESKAVAAMRKHFRNLVDETASKRNFLKSFKRRAPEDVLKPKVLFGPAAAKRAVVEDISISKEIEGFPAAPENEGKSTSTASRHTGGFDVELTAEYLEDEATTLAATTLAAIEGETNMRDRAHRLSSEPRNKQSLADQHTSEEPVSPFKNASKQVTLSQPTCLTSSQKIVPDKKANNRSPAVTSSTRPKRKSAAGPTTGKNNSTSNKKSKVSSKAFSRPSASKNQKGMQSLIVDFFKKSGDDVDSTRVESASQKEKSAASESSTDLQLSREVPDHMRAGQESNAANLAPAQAGKREWIDEYEQLASILDESISKERAEVLLEKARGDVGMALDLFYAEQQQDVPEISETQPCPTPQCSTLNLVASSQPTIDDKLGTSTCCDDNVIPIVEDEDDQNLMSEPQAGMTTKWLQECEQFMIVLDGKVSREQAYNMLEKENGDVGVVLDKFYADEGKIVVSCKPELDSDSQIRSTGEPHSQTEEVLSTVREPPQSTSGAIRSTKAEVEVEIEVEAQAQAQAQAQAVAEGAEEVPSEVPAHVVPTNERNALAPTPFGKKSAGSVSETTLEKINSVAIAVDKYSPINHACWKMGEPAPYLHLARAFDLIEHESGRLKTTDMLCNMFRSLLALSPEALLPAMYITTNRLAPDFESGELSIGGSLVASAVSEVAGVSRARLREMHSTMGDLGDVAQACRQTQSSLRLPPPLGICQVFSTLKQISKEAGSGSGARKKDLVLGLLRSCREKEMKYIVRTLIQNMRIGAMMKTVLAALAQAVVLHHSFTPDKAPDKAISKLRPKIQEASAALVEAYNFLPNLDLIVPALIKDGIAGLSADFTISPGTPIKPMLAKITNGIPDLLKRFQGQAFTCEYKYDGQRAQIHLMENSTVRIFSRDSADATGRFPDVINIVRDAAREDLRSFIIDAEVVAVNRMNDNRLMAFQHLSTRERGGRDGSSVDVQNIKVHVGVFVFDIMFANGESLVKKPFHERRKFMRHWFPNVKPGYFGYAGEITIEAEEEPDSISQRIQTYMEEAFAASCEGLMAKALLDDSTYMASKRSDSWMKIKRDYVQGLQDSLDLVPIGAWHGNGRKAGWYSPFLLACYDPEQEVYQSVCRVMSGFTDAFYKEMTEFYSGDRILPRRPPYYRTGEEPSVWFTPELVWEIRGADFTISPVHQAAVGLIHESRGISMRFPRFIRSRPDKKPDIASTPAEIADLFHKQTRKLDVPGSSSAKGEQMEDPDE